jgi:hypothetical protein
MSVLFGDISGMPTAGAIQNPPGQNSFERAYAGEWWTRLWLKLTGRDQHLYDLAQTATAGSVQSRRYGGLRSVPLHQIQGSEGRAQEFTRDFRPLREHTQERWRRVATAMARGYALPPVDLIKIGDIYFVRDGHHRVSVAKARGGVAIDAQVVVWEV